MQDEIAIQNLMNLYTHGSSRADWDAVTGTFLPDGIWHLPGLDKEYRGHDAIRAAMSAFVAKMEYFVQINSPATIVVDGDRASARSIIRECGKYADRDEALEVMGFYSDSLVRTAGGWKFERRTFRGAGMHTFAVQRARL